VKEREVWEERDVMRGGKKEEGVRMETPTV
jgi:hypothetical protein